MSDCKCKGDKTHWMWPCRECYHAQLRARMQRTEPDWADYANQLSRAGLPALALGCLSSSPGVTDAMTEAKRFFADPFDTAPGLGLLGPAGRGKTVAAGWVMWQVLRDKGFNNGSTGGLSSPVMLVEASDLTGVSEKRPIDATWLDDLRRVTFLVLDDVGDEATVDGVAALAKLIKQRHGSGRRTMLTSNLRRDAFVVRYGGAVADRMRLIELPAGRSMRQQKPEVRT